MRMANTERLFPRATTALAKTVWERQREPSARKVARALAAAGYPVHFTTVALWKRTESTGKPSPFRSGAGGP